MKLYHYIRILYHSRLKQWHKRSGDYQSGRFEHHHKKMRRHKERPSS